MARLVIGTSKTATTAGMVKRPQYCVTLGVDPVSNQLVKTTPTIDLAGVTKIGTYALAYEYYSSPSVGTANLSDVQEIDTCGMLSFFQYARLNSGVDMSSLIEVASSGLYNAFYGSELNGPVDFSSLTTVQPSGMYAAFYNATGLTSVDLSSLTTVGASGLSEAFYGSSMTSLDLSSLTTVLNSNAFVTMCSSCTSLTTVDLSNLTNIGFSGTYPDNLQYSGSNFFRSVFYGCTGLTTVDLSSLEYLTGPNGYIFQNCTDLVSVEMSKLKLIWGVGSSSSTAGAAANMFASCTSLTSVSLKSLEMIYGPYTGGSSYRGYRPTAANMFYGCTSLVSQKFESLKLVHQYAGCYMFASCTSLQDLWFYAFDPSQSSNLAFTYMLSSCTNVTVHFPMAAQSSMESWADVTGGFGGTNTTVLFDLVTSLTGADTNTYIRSEKNSTSTATAWLYNDTLYYTSGVSDHTNGVNEPAVGTTIYSDAACTTSVTTVTAIA